MNINGPSTSPLSKPAAAAPVTSPVVDKQVSWTFTSSPQAIKGIQETLARTAATHGLTLQTRTEVISSGGFFGWGTNLALTVDLKGSKTIIELLERQLAAVPR
jgi:hypothetical protein